MYLCELVKNILVNCLMIEIDVLYLLLCMLKLMLKDWCNELMFLLYIVEELVCDCGEDVVVIVVNVMVVVCVFFCLFDVG